MTPGSSSLLARACTLQPANRCVISYQLILERGKDEEDYLLET